MRRERLADIGHDTVAEIAREGFAGMTLGDFFDMFCQHNACAIDDVVTRIEFEYVEPPK